MRYANGFLNMGVLTIGAATTFASFGAQAASSSSYVADCALALKQDIVNQKSNYILKYAYLNILLSNKALFDKASQDGSLKIIIEDVPLGFDYSQESIRKYTEQIKTATHTTYDLAESEAYVSSSLSRAGADAFVQCVKSTVSDVGVVVSMSDSDKAVANIKIDWLGLTGIGDVKVFMTVKGGAIEKGTDPNGQKFSGKGQASALVVREAGKSLSVVVNIKKADGTLLKTDSQLIPKFTHWVNQPTTRARSSSSSGRTCGWYNGLMTIGPTVEVRIANDLERVIPETAVWVPERQDGPLNPAKTSYGAGYYDWNERNGTVVSAHAICNPADAAVEAVVAGHITVAVQTRNLVDEGAANFASNPILADFDKNRLFRLNTREPAAASNPTN